MDFNLVRLQLSLPNSAGPALQTALHNKRSCFEQPLAALCERPLSNDPELVRRHQKPSLPFVLAVPEENLLTCQLLGPAIAELRSVVATIAAVAGMPCPARVAALDYQGTVHPVALDGGSDLPVLSAAELLELAAARYCGCHQVRLELLSPLRLVADGRELTRFDPARFLRTLLRRISSLAAHYGTAGAPEPFVRLAQRAAEITVSRNYATAKVSGKRGITGSFLLQGDFGELGPLLELGGLLHLGKGAAFGNGRFRVTPLS